MKYEAYIDYLKKVEKSIDTMNEIVDYIISNNIDSKLELTEYEKQCIFCKHNYKPLDCVPRCNCMCENHSDFKLTTDIKDINKG